MQDKLAEWAFVASGAGGQGLPMHAMSQCVLVAGCWLRRGEELTSSGKFISSHLHARLCPLALGAGLSIQTVRAT